LRKSHAYYLAVACVLALLVAAMDQGIKGLVVASLQHGSRHLIPGIVDLSYQQNTGAAFSLFTRAPVAVLIGVNLLVLGFFLALIYPHLRRKSGMLAAVLVIGGALGNLIDRVCRHYVVDYLDLRFMRWPVFNFADMSIVIGVIVLVVVMLVAERQTLRSKESHADAANAH
jgi:signal peptidase II